MRLLFLDMDGVVNKAYDNCSPDRFHYNDKWVWMKGKCDLTYVDPELAARVTALVNDFDMHIVSSSSWRLYNSQKDFSELLKARGLPGERLVGYTPDLSLRGKSRKEEIKDFLEYFDKPVEVYVILDDDPFADASSRKGKFFQTDFFTGYTAEQDKKVRNYLERKLNDNRTGKAG